MGKVNVFIAYVAEAACSGGILRYLLHFESLFDFYRKDFKPCYIHTLKLSAYYLACS